MILWAAVHVALVVDEHVRLERGQHHASGRENDQRGDQAPVLAGAEDAGPRLETHLAFLLFHIFTDYIYYY